MNSNPRHAISVLLFAALMVPRESHADCPTPDQEIAWSFPTDGQSISVFSKSVILYSEYNNVSSVRLDDVEILRSQDSRYAYPLGGNLAPGQHVLDVELYPCHEDCARRIEFTAVELEPENAPSAPTTSAPGPWTAPGDFILPSHCAALLPYSCYDVGDPPPLMSFDLDADPGALINVVEYSVDEGSGRFGSFLWPTECGAPFFHGPYSPSVETCAWAQSIGKDGSFSPKSPPLCHQVVDQPEPEQSQATPENCSSGSLPSAVNAFILAAIVFRRRRPHT